MTYAHAFLVPRSRKPVLYTFRALPSIHTANPDTFRQHPSLHLSPFTGYPVLLAPPCSTRSTGSFGAHADPSCIRAIPRERTSKDEHLDHAGCNVPSPSLLLAVTPSLFWSCFVQLSHARDPGPNRNKRSTTEAPRARSGLMEIRYCVYDREAQISYKKWLCSIS